MAHHRPHHSEADGLQPSSHVHSCYLRAEMLREVQKGLCFPEKSESYLSVIPYFLHERSPGTSDSHRGNARWNTNSSPGCY